MDLYTVTAAIRVYSLYQENKDLDRIVRLVLDLRKEQIMYWEKLQCEVNALKEGPFYSAKTILNDASKSYRTEDEKSQMINEARIKFIDALGIIDAQKNKTYVDLHQKSYIQFHISLCWFLLGKKFDSIDWIEDAIFELDKAEKNLLLEKSKTEKEIQENMKTEIYSNFRKSFNISASAMTAMLNNQLNKSKLESKTKDIQLFLKDFREFLKETRDIIQHQEN